MYIILKWGQTLSHSRSLSCCRTGLTMAQVQRFILISGPNIVLMQFRLKYLTATFCIIIHEYEQIMKWLNFHYCHHIILFPDSKVYIALLWFQCCISDHSCVCFQAVRSWTVTRIVNSHNNLFPNHFKHPDFRTVNVLIGSMGSTDSLFKTNQNACTHSAWSYTQPHLTFSHFSNTTWQDIL